MNFNRYQLITLHTLVANRLAKLDDFIESEDYLATHGAPDLAEAVKQADQRYRADLQTLLDTIDATI